MEPRLEYFLNKLEEAIIDLAESNHSISKRLKRAFCVINPDFFDHSLMKILPDNIKDDFYYIKKELVDKVIEKREKEISKKTNLMIQIEESSLSEKRIEELQIIASQRLPCFIENLHWKIAQKIVKSITKIYLNLKYYK
jgi:hypothetical protein